MRDPDRSPTPNARWPHPSPLGPPGAPLPPGSHPEPHECPPVSPTAALDTVSSPAAACGAPEGRGLLCPNDVSLGGCRRDLLAEAGGALQGGSSGGSGGTVEPRPPFDASPASSPELEPARSRVGARSSGGAGLAAFSAQPSVRSRGQTPRADVSAPPRPSPPSSATRPVAHSRHTDSSHPGRTRVNRNSLVIRELTSTSEDSGESWVDGREGVAIPDGAWRTR